MNSALARTLISTYKKRHHVESNDEIDWDKMFQEIAQRGDFAGFVAMKIWLDKSDYDDYCVGNALLEAAQCGHWNIIELIFNIESSLFDSEVAYGIVEGAIEGNHLDIIKKCHDDLRLRFLLRETAPLTMCVTWQRHDILLYLLDYNKQHPDFANHLKEIAQTIVSNLSIATAELMLFHFPGFRFVLKEYFEPVKSFDNPDDLINVPYDYVIMAQMLK